MTTRAFIISILLLLTIQIHGQIITERDILEQPDSVLRGRIEEVTITAFRTPYNLINTPAPINLITSEILSTGDGTTPVEILNQVPGIYMHHGTLNTNRLTIRGIGSRTPYASNKIKAYLGEIPLTSGDGETTLEDIENLSVSRIEIIKGPASSLYGSGLAGAILFQPKHVQSNYIRNNTMVGSFGTIKNTTTAGLKTEKLNVFALGSYLNSDGYRDNNNTRRGNVLLNGHYFFSPNTNLQVLLKGTNMKGYIPSSLNEDDFLNNPQMAAPGWAAVNGFEDYITGQFGVSLNIYTENNEKISAGTFGSIKNLDETRPFNRLEEQSGFIGWRAYIQKYIPGQDNNFVFTSGLEFFRERYTWLTYTNQSNLLLSDNEEKRQYENLFIQMEADFQKKLYLSTGLNVNLTRFKYTDNYIENGDHSGNHSYQPVLSPRLGVNYVLQDNWNLFGNISHGFSTPTFEETLRPEGEINPEIKPEKGLNLEFGVRTQIQERFNLSASYYRIYISDLLVARRTELDAYVGVNAGKSLHPGFETEFQWQITSPSYYPGLILKGNLSLSNNHFTDFVDQNIDYSGNSLPGTPKQTWFLNAIAKPIRNTSIYIWYRHTGEMPLDDANSKYSDPYGITQVEANYRIPLNKVLLGFKFGVNNLFDVHYASMLLVNAMSFNGAAPRYYYPGNPRNYYFSIEISLNQ